jgi:putative transposase
MPKPPRRISPRLPSENYVGWLAAHLTLVTNKRRVVFDNDDSVQATLSCLEEARAKHDATIYAYCFMPDHLHLLVLIPEGKSMQKFVRLFKQLSGYLLKQVDGLPVWQVSYHDHILRNDEAIHDVAGYIWNNPREAGLVEDRTSYPYSGPRENFGAS